MAVKNKVRFLGVAAVALILLAIVTLVGIAITREYSVVLRSSTTVNASDEILVASLNAPNTSNSVGSTGTYPFLQTLTGCANSTTSFALNPLPTSFYSIGEGDSDGGSITLNQDGIKWTGLGINCSSLTYLAGTTAQISADTFIVALSIFGTFASVIVLALVGKAIINLFKKKD